MRIVLQRVQRAEVKVDGQVVAKIGRGMLLLLGVGMGDSSRDCNYLAEKVANLRVFDDERGKMNLSIKDVGGEILVVSQFTLYADCRKGRRPSFDEAASPEKAENRYNEFVMLLRQKGVKVAEGIFQARMQVELVNDGPVTILLESPSEKGSRDEY